MKRFDPAKILLGPLLAVQGSSAKRREYVGRGAHLIGVILISILALCTTAVSQTVYPNPATVDLLTAGNFRILAGTTVTIGSSTTVTGDVGVSPGSTVTNNGAVNGTVHLNTAEAIQAQSHLTAAYNDAAGRTTDETVATELGTTTLGRGVYVSAAGTFGITGTLTLTGTASDVFIFKMATTLTTGASSSVTLTGGVLASNVFWQVGSSATIDGDFKGNILALTAITQNTGPSSIDGRLLARNSFVTVGGTEVLPVQLAAFTATANRLNVQLHWTTATETHNYGFEIERRGVSRILTGARGYESSNEWKRVGFVQGAGTSSSPKKYTYVDHVTRPARYAYRIKQIDNDGTFEYFYSAEVDVGLMPQKLTLEQNYPNPCNPLTKIEFTLPGDGEAELKIFNQLGQEVATVFDEVASGGRLYQTEFNAAQLPSGVYFVRLKYGNQSLTGKMLLLK